MGIIVILILGVFFLDMVIRDKKEEENKEQEERKEKNKRDNHNIIRIKNKTKRYIERIKECYNNGFTVKDLKDLLPTGYLTIENRENPGDMWFFSENSFEKMQEEGGDWKYLYADYEIEDYEMDKFVDEYSNYYVPLIEEFKVLDNKRIGTENGRLLHITHKPEDEIILGMLWSDKRIANIIDFDRYISYYDTVLTFEMSYVKDLVEEVLTDYFVK